MNASDMPITDATVSAPVPGRAVDLQMRVSVPISGRNLPVILLSHGHGNSWYLSSLNGYGTRTWRDRWI